jgi:VWFA-related protein
VNYNRAMLWSVRRGAAALVGFVGCLASAAAPPSAAQAPATQAPTAPAEQPTFRVNVDLVTLDVIPRAANGQFVADLGKDDFQVLEDGIDQQVVSLVMVHGGRVFNVLQPPNAAGSDPPEGIILPRSRPVADTAGRIFVLLVDDLHFTAIETTLVRALLKKVVGRLFHPGDMFAMFSTGPSSIEIPVSYDRGLLDSAISRVSGHGMSYRDIMDSLDSSQGPQGLRYNAHVAFRTAYQLLGNLEQIRNRRKVLLLVSNGYDFDPFPQGRAGTDQVFGGRYGSPWVDPERGDRFLALEEQNNRFADADLASELAAVTGAANRVNAAIYTLDPRGVVGTTSLADNVDIGEMRMHISKSQGSLRTLAEATGGFAVVNDNTYDAALTRIDAETSDYYILGYYASDPDPKRRNRSVEVKTRRPDVQVWSRGWYRTRAGQPPLPKH